MNGWVSVDSSRVPFTVVAAARRRYTRSVIAAVALTCAIGTIAPLPAPAARANPAAPSSPTSDSESLDPEHIEAVAEQYNLARLNVVRATAALEATDRRIDAARLRVRLMQSRTRARAASLYLGAGAAPSIPVGDTRHVADLHRRSQYLDAAEAPDRELLAALKRELQTLATERVSQRAATELLQRNADAAKQMKRRLDQLAAAAEAAQAQARAAAALAPAGVGADPDAIDRAPAGPPSGTPPTPPTTRPAPGPPSTPPTTRPPPGPTPEPPPTGAEPPVSPGAGAAVAFARAQLGKPYVFATSGPNTYDCSGLTMAAWASGGVRMPHYSGAQSGMFPKVSFAQLKPGDILVFYPDLHHVGLYIGDGMMIHANQTGDVVKISPAWRDTFRWGVRPS